MFSESYTYLRQALGLAQQKNPDFYTIRSVLKAALNAAVSDTAQPAQLRQAAAQSIEQAISYTYSRVNPAPFAPMTFQSMLTPISPFQQNRMGPFGFVKGPMVPGHPDLVPTAWRQDYRETQAFILMIRAAISIVRRGLH